MGAPTPPSSFSWEHASLLRQGSIHRSNDIPCQDTVVSQTLSSFVIHLVLDGHGPDGHTIAETCATLLRQNLVNSLPSVPPNNPNLRETAVFDAFEATVKAIDRRADSFDSGATATVVVIGNGWVTVANVGDSAAVIAAPSGGVRTVTVSHSVTNAVERRRVERSGARVGHGYMSDEGDNKVIAVTRAFGDRDVRSIGLIAEPHIYSFKEEDVEWMVIASDGLWDANGGVNNEMVAAWMRDGRLTSVRDLAHILGQRASIRRFERSNRNVETIDPSDDLALVVVRRRNDGA